MKIRGALAIILRQKLTLILIDVSRPYWDPWPLNIPNAQHSVAFSPPIRASAQIQLLAE